LIIYLFGLLTYLIETVNFLSTLSGVVLDNATPLLTYLLSLYCQCLIQYFWCCFRWCQSYATFCLVQTSTANFL